MANETETIELSGTVSASATLSATCYYVEVHNQGANTAFINFNATATTSNMELTSGETFCTFGDITSIHGVCLSTLSATLQVVGVR